jgi:hypothetical protein
LGDREGREFASFFRHVIEETDGQMILNFEMQTDFVIELEQSEQ